MPTWIELTPCNGKIYVIADIHGCYRTLSKLLEDIVRPTPDDTLIFLGDYIDRGPASAGVVDYLIGLSATFRNVHCLRGNHEENLLQTIKEYDPATVAHVLRKINKTPDLLDETGHVRKTHIEFFESLPYYIELPDFWIVHGGFDFRKPDPFSDFSSMINFYIDNNNYDASILQGKRMIHGHRLTYLDDIVNMVKTRAPIISLDNGCVYHKKHKIYDVSKLGNLCCLELTQMQLFYTPNIDF